MKIGVNARFLNKPYTGIGMYTRYLFDELARQNPKDEYLMVTDGEIPFQMQKNIRIIILKESFPGTGGMRKTFWEQKQVPDILLREKVDIAHFPYPCNPWNRFTKPTVVTVHDTIPWTMKSYRKSFSTRVYQDMCKLAVKKADCVLAVSESAKKEISAVCGIASDDITVGYNSLPDYFFVRQENGRRNAILNKYGIRHERPYLLYVGGYDERKNVKMLIDVYRSEISRKYDLDLVLAGGKLLDDKLYGSYDAGKMTDSSLRAKGTIRLTGFVDAADLPSIYQSAFAFITLSEKEGFNVPLLEAAVSGIPIITSDIPVHHEIVGDTAIYCDMGNHIQIASAITGLFIDKDRYLYRKNMAEAFVCPFSWGKTAEKISKIYREYVG